MPPSLMPEQMIGSPGPGGAMSPNPGLAADAMSKVREAVNLLQMALPGFPQGSDEHSAVLGAVSKLAKMAPAHQENQGVQQQTLLGLLQQAKQSAMLRGLAGGAGAGGGGDMGGGGPPGGQMPGM